MSSERFSDNNDDSNDPDKGHVVGLSGPTKTPFYQASNSDRYYRQTLIKKIQELAKTRRLLCYVSGINAGIDRDDILGFTDLLHNVSPNDDVDLLLHTPGGDVDAAEKIAALLHMVVGVGQLRVVVPDFAKSAGTLIALGANKILMSSSSELGPVDPQISLNDGRGNLIPCSVLSYLDAYATHARRLTENPNDPVARMMLSKLDPVSLRTMESVRDRARNFAEDQLNRWMFQKKKAHYTKIASDLMDIRRWPSHGQMIGYDDAVALELEVEYIDWRSDLWRCYWHLYCLQRLAIRDNQKLFESDYASLIMGGQD